VKLTNCDYQQYDRRGFEQPEGLTAVLRHALFLLGPEQIYRATRNSPLTTLTTRSSWMCPNQRWTPGEENLDLICGRKASVARFEVGGIL
jgi:hypothetical protein